MKPTWITTVWAVLGKSMGWSSSKNKTIYYSENWVRRIEPTKNITQEIAKKWRNYEEYAVSKRMESDNWELKKENPSAVNQLLSQIQELQDKVNSLNEEKEFCALETAISSGMFHVLNQPSSIPSPRGMIGRDSCLQPDTRNSLGTLEHVFEGPPAAEWPSPSFFKIPKNLTSSPCELRSGETESTMRHGEGLRQGTARVQKYRLLDLPGKTRPGIPCIILEELILKIIWWKRQGTLSRNCISENSQTQVTFNVGESISRSKCVCESTPFPQLTMSWINEVEMAKSIDDLVM